MPGKGAMSGYPKSKTKTTDLAHYFMEGPNSLTKKFDFGGHRPNGRMPPPPATSYVCSSLTSHICQVMMNAECCTASIRPPGIGIVSTVMLLERK